MKDQDTGEFSLEDIIREFGGKVRPEPSEEPPAETPEEPAAEVPEEPQPEAPQELSEQSPAEAAPREANETEPAEPESAPVPEEPAEPEPAPVPVPEEPAETKPVPVPEESAEPEPAPEPEEAEPAGQEPETTPDRSGEPETEPCEDVPKDTIRLDDIQKVVSETSAPEEEEPLPPPEAPEAQVEPFSEGWEPSYEKPIGEYEPPKPIEFRPRSRFLELRRKLAAGPEQRYYALTELGVGKLQLSIFLNLLVFLLSAGATVLDACGLVGDGRLRLMVFSQFLAMLVSALLGCYQLLEGVEDLFHKRFTLNTLLTVSFVFCCVDGVMCLRQLRVPCCAAFSLEMTLSLWASYERRVTQIGEMDTMRKAASLTRVAAVPDLYEGRPGYQIQEGQVEDFMEQYQTLAAPERVLNGFALVSMILSLILGGVAWALHGMFAGVQVCTVSLLVSVPATSFISVTRPMAVLEKRLHRVGAVLCGWPGVRAVRRKSVYPLKDEELFPNGSTRLNGMKFYGECDPDEAVAYATALVSASGSGLEPLFTQLLDSRNGRHYEVDQIRDYPEGGIGGEINGESVLIGTLEFMQTYGVEMPQGANVNQAVYLAIDLRLCAIFAVNYGRNASAAAGLAALCGNRALKPVMTCTDFVLSESFLRAKFGVNARRIGFPARSVRQELRNREAVPDATPVALVTRPGLAPRAYALTGSRALRAAVRAGNTVNMGGGIVGLLMMAVLAYLGAVEALTPVNVLLFELLWALPGLLVTELTRTGT